MGRLPIAIVGITLAALHGCTLDTNGADDDDDGSNTSSLWQCTPDHATVVAGSDLQCSGAITVTTLSDNYALLATGCQKSLELSNEVWGPPGTEACQPGTLDNSVDVASSDFSCAESNVVVAQVCVPTGATADCPLEPYGDFRDSASGCGYSGLYGNCDASGCAPIEEGTLAVDGQPFVLADCESGQSNFFPEEGFFGVDLVDATSMKLRLVQEIDGTLTVLLFPTGASTAVTMPAGCGQSNLTPGDEVYNGYNGTTTTGHDISGTATMDCTAAEHTVTGSATLTACW